MYISPLASVLGISSIPLVLESTVRLSTCQTPYRPSVESEPNTPSVARRRLPRIVVIPPSDPLPRLRLPLGTTSLILAPNPSLIRVGTILASRGETFKYGIGKYKEGNVGLVSRGSVARMKETGRDVGEAEQR